MFLDVKLIIVVIISIISVYVWEVNPALVRSRTMSGVGFLLLPWILGWG